MPSLHKRLERWREYNRISEAGQIARRAFANNSFDGILTMIGVVMGKLDELVAFNASGSLPENVSYALKSSYILSFLESVPEVATNLKEPNALTMPFEDTVKAAEEAAALVIVY